MSNFLKTKWGLCAIEACDRKPLDLPVFWQNEKLPKDLAKLAGAVFVRIVAFVDHFEHITSLIIVAGIRFLGPTDTLRIR